jgi:hypothetical protein
MDFIKKNHISKSDLYKSKPSAKSHAMKQQSEWNETFLHGTRLDRAHDKVTTSDVLRLTKSKVNQISFVLDGLHHLLNFTDI